MSYIEQGLLVYVCLLRQIVGDTILLEIQYNLKWPVILQAAKTVIIYYKQFSQYFD